MVPKPVTFLEKRHKGNSSCDRMMVIPSEGRRPVDLALRGVTDISKSGVYRTLTSGALPLSGQLSFTATSHPCTLSMCCLEPFAPVIRAEVQL